ncbi:Uncharacterized protein (Fragment) [Durusdinium trenchii]|uniref:Acid phosphatase n=1 Tax=Durusdinium trenchii TaxID=1381693 RepID=A0ABP0L2R5_9DINO
MKIAGAEACVFSLCGVWAHTTAQNDRLQSSIQELDLRMLVDKQHVETGASRFTVYCIQNLISQRSTSSGQLQRLVGKLREMAMGTMHLLEEEAPGQELRHVSAFPEKGGSHSVAVEPRGIETGLLPGADDTASRRSSTELALHVRVGRSDQVIHLFRKHVMHMDTVTKTRLVDALQRQHDFYANRLQQELVVELLESTTGDELRMMKDILDEGGDFYNLHKLVFHDLDPEMHSRVLSHIQQQGRRLAKQYDPGQAPMKIVSDVDDTLYGSGGHFPAGCDEREPRDKMRAFEGFLRKRFDEASSIRLNSVHSVDSFWRYFNESFQAAIYGTDTARYYFPGAVVPTWLQVLGPNYLYGMGRMRECTARLGVPGGPPLHPFGRPVEGDVSPRDPKGPDSGGAAIPELVSHVLRRLRP